MLDKNKIRIHKPLVKKRWGMYPEQFLLLQKGDIIKDESDNLRIIEEVSSNKKNKGTTYIILLKLRQSWTKSKYTYYGVSDCSNFRPVKVNNKKIWYLTPNRIIKNRKNRYVKYVNNKILHLQKTISVLKQQLYE